MCIGEIQNTFLTSTELTARKKSIYMPIFSIMRRREENKVWEISDNKKKNFSS